MLLLALFFILKKKRGLWSHISLCVSVYLNFFGLNAVHVKSKEIGRSFVLRFSCYIVTQLQEVTEFGNWRLLSVVMLISKRAEKIIKIREETILKTMKWQSIYEYLDTKKTWELWRDSLYILWLSRPKTRRDDLNISGRTHMVTMKRQCIHPVTQRTYDQWRDDLNISGRTHMVTMKRHTIFLQLGGTWDS
jgi:hypothetical protein